MSILGSSDTFEFSAYDFNELTGKVTLQYRCGEYKFTETIFLDTTKPFLVQNSEALNRSLKLLHLTAGISYYKAFVNDVSFMNVKYKIPNCVANYLNTLYEEGLGEFYYINKLKPSLKARFIGDGEVDLCKDMNLSGYLVGLGGGKDSLVAVKLLQLLGLNEVSTFGINAQNILTKQAEILDTNHMQVKRIVDVETLVSIKTTDDTKVPNGHIPISAILSSIGLVQAILSGFSHVVMAVERSADEPTHSNYYGKSINHQFSKSREFESGFNFVINSWVSKSMGFFSILRPLRELDIMRLFYALNLDELMNGHYTSCNKSLDFTSGKQSNSLWCGNCEKCAFIFLLMTGAGQYKDAVRIFGEDLIAKPEFTNTYKELLGLAPAKPFDCVGEINESREAMDVAKISSVAAKNFDYPAPEKSNIWDEHHYIPHDIADKLRDLVERTLAK